MLIYASHKYGGLEENKAAAEEKIKQLQLNDKENTYLSPIHALGFIYEHIDYDEGMELCLDLLTACDELYVLSDISEGVKREIELAEKLGMPIRYIEEQQ